MTDFDLYEVLGVERRCSAGEIKKAYYAKAREHHPDKGGDTEVFKKLQKAYEVLGNDESRNYYDQTGQVKGEQGAPPEGGDGGGMPFGGFNIPIHELFGMFGGGGMRGGPGGMPAPTKKAKEPPKVLDVPLSLSHFYNGHKLEVRMGRQKFCGPCGGKGSTERETCRGCNGAGMITRQIQMGPFMGTTTGPCDVCLGQRTVPKGTCETCSGTGFLHEETALPVIIPKGSRPGDVLVFAEACSDSHHYEKRGDVHIRLSEADDSEGWVRKGQELHYDFKIGLSEAMCGTRRVVRGHPRYPEGFYMLVLDVPVVTGDTIVLKEMGMPSKEDPDRFGDRCGKATSIKEDSSTVYGDVFLHVYVYPTKEERVAWATDPPKRSPTIGNVFDEVITMPVLSPSVITHVKAPDADD